MGDRNHRSGDVRGPVQMGDGVQFNAGRDQFVAYRDQYVAGRDQVVHDRETREVIAELASLRQALEELRLTSGERDRAERELTAMEGAMNGREPDVKAVEGHLQSFTAGLKEAGALASAGTSLAVSIGTIAHWLGPLGAAVIALL